MKRLHKVLLSAVLLALLTTLSIYAAGNKAQIQVLGDFYDFGYVPMDYRLIHHFRVKNVGNSDLNIEKAVSNCDCTSVVIMKKILAPDSVGEIKVIFDTREYYGKNTRDITLHTNADKNPAVVMRYSSDIGVIPREFRTEPTSLFFLPGHQAKDLKLYNLTGESLEYSIEMEIDSIYSINSPKGIIKKGEAALIEVTPGKDLPRGTHYSNFTVSYNTEPETRLTIPVKMLVILVKMVT